ncbi:ADP-ribosylation/Crystallin J1 [Scenedesmus sp. NREL 46B-D3]|nr:ADP-ribosylation/Crystallin J1 [Scenedesmus sp. NREL 46B-D3]
MSSSDSHAAEASTSYEERVIGSVLGAMCGDTLGASVEGWSAERIQSACSDGLKTFQKTERGYGCYTDDSQMLVALAASLINRQRCDAADAARQYARAFDPQRGYGGSAVKILTRLSQGADPATTATQFLPGGSFANGGAMRIAPVGLAYRNADAATLQQAVEAALLCTHVHPLGVEGAVAQALAVAELSRTQPPVVQAAADAPNAAGLSLLRSLQEQLPGSEEMASKLQVLEQALQQAPPDSPAFSGWRQYLQSPGWQHEVAVAGAVAPGFQIKATDAVAAALWAVVRHWRSPADALVAAVHYGGDTDTIACMAGAMMGALHGTSWLPQAWLSNLENGSRPPNSNPGEHRSFFDQAAADALLAGEGACRKTRGAAADAPAAAGAGGADAGGVDVGDVVYTTRDMGRDAAMQLARLLAQLDCTTM